MRLVGDIYDSNVFVENIDKNIFIIDAGANFDKINDVAENVRAIFLTHGHFDHAYFVEDYAKKLNVKIYAREKIREYLEEPKKNYSTDFNCDLLKISDFSDFVFLQGDREVKMGNVVIKYFQMGGHSKSDMCFLIGEDLFVGDLIIGRGIGRMDLYGGSKQEMIKSLKKLATLNYKTMHCGHGEDLSKEMADKVISTYLKFLTRG